MKDEWIFTGCNSKGKPKFSRLTNQTLEHVLEYLKKHDVAYLVYEGPRLIFIFQDKEPKNAHSKRYAYYYTTGRWGSDKRNKHYHSRGIEDFMKNYYLTTEQAKERWGNKEPANDHR